MTVYTNPINLRFGIRSQARKDAVVLWRALPTSPENAKQLIEMDDLLGWNHKRTLNAWDSLKKTEKRFIDNTTSYSGNSVAGMFRFGWFKTKTPHK